MSFGWAGQILRVDLSNMESSIEPVEPYIQSFIGGRGINVKMKQPFAGEIEVYGSPFKMSKTPSRVTGHAPLLGEHNRQILSRVLGYTNEEIDKLFKEEVIYEEEAVHRLNEELRRLKRETNSHFVSE